MNPSTSASRRVRSGPVSFRAAEKIQTRAFSGSSSNAIRGIRSSSSVQDSSLEYSPVATPTGANVQSAAAIRPAADVHGIAATTHGRYLVAPADTPGPAPLLVGFHGYGEHAERHLVELERIPGSGRWTRVAVQALHRHYSESRRHVVGSWMTRQGPRAGHRRQHRLRPGRGQRRPRRVRDDRQRGSTAASRREWPWPTGPPCGPDTPAAA